MRGIFWLAFVGVGGGLVAMIWIVLKR